MAAILKPEDDTLVNIVLKDNNLSTIKYSPEFVTYKNPNNPSNRIHVTVPYFALSCHYFHIEMKGKKRLFQLLQKPYIDTRYRNDKSIKLEKLDVLIEKIKSCKPSFLRGANNSNKIFNVIMSRLLVII